MPACESYRLPQKIREHVDYITPGIKLLAPVESHQSKRDAALGRRDARIARIVHDLSKVNAVPPSNPDDLSTCDVAITPAVSINLLYPKSSHEQIFIKFSSGYTETCPFYSVPYT
jgi:hypothetical protein